VKVVASLLLRFRRLHHSAAIAASDQHCWQHLSSACCIINILLTQPQAAEKHHITIHTRPVLQQQLLCTPQQLYPASAVDATLYQRGVQSLQY
jgi:hypothetical protein